MTSRATADAIVQMIVTSPVDGVVQIQVLREYQYLRPNQRGQTARHSVHRLNKRTLLLSVHEPETWSDAWYIIFDLVSAMARTGPAQRHWYMPRAGGTYIDGAIEMLARSIARELNFEIVTSDGMKEEQI